jgi:hypothetical protein
MPPFRGWSRPSGTGGLIKKQRFLSVYNTFKEYFVVLIRTIGWDYSIINI